MLIDHLLNILLLAVSGNHFYQFQETMQLQVVMIPMPSNVTQVMLFRATEFIVLKQASINLGLFSPILEPHWLNLRDRKSPGNRTMFLFTRGQCLRWDATYVDTLKQFINMLSSTTSSTEKATDEKIKEKYLSLMDPYILQPVAVEISGVFGPYTLTVVSITLCGVSQPSPVIYLEVHFLKGFIWWS